MKSLKILILCFIFGVLMASCEDRMEAEIIPTAPIDQEKNSAQSEDSTTDSSLDARLTPLDTDEY